jgi:RNA polymerase sigma factor (sigma-70 family)
LKGIEGDIRVRINAIPDHYPNLSEHCMTQDTPSPPATPEQRFLSYANTGDMAIIQALIREYADRSYNQARRIIGNDDGADDAVQDAYLGLVSTANRYDGSVPFAAWLGRLVISAAIDYRRRLPRHMNLSDISDRGEAAMSDHAAKPGTTDQLELEVLRSALDSLPDRYRTPLTMHYLGGLNQSETAEALGISLKTIETQLGRGLERLRGKLVRAGFAVTSAGLLATFSSLPTYAASPAFITSLTATRRLTAIGRHASERMLTAKKVSMAAGSGFFKAGVMGAIAVLAALTLPVLSKDDPAKQTVAAATLMNSSHTPFGGTPWAIPGIIEAENYDLGGQGIAYHDLPDELTHPNDAYRADGDDIISGDDGLVVGWTLPGEWLIYSVNVRKSGVYTLETRVSAWDSGGTFHIEFSGGGATEPIAMPEYTGTWKTAAPWQTLSTKVSLTAGQQVMKIYFDNHGRDNFEVANLNYVRLTAPGSPK